MWNKSKWDRIVGLVVLIAVALLVNYQFCWSVETSGQRENQTVVLDPGHGGIDPGKVGKGNVLEKDINLAISLYVKEFLEQQQIPVIMTRQEDAGLYEENDSNKKLSDMEARCSIIEQSSPALTVSIHQNSYSDSSVKGAQVFYYKKSQEGAQIAEIMQKALRDGLDRSNTREPKANDDYYMLRHTEGPAVIVECGFLTNPQEARLLGSEEYQKKVAQAIADGILTYLRQ